MALKEEEAATKKKLIGIRMKRSGGDGLPLVKRYKAADFGNGPVLSRISTSPNLSPRSTHAPENRVVWWGYFGTREVIKGDGLCQGVQSCHEFQRVHISILVVHTPHTTGRVSRCLKPTVWTVEQSVSGVLYISSLLRSPKLPKRKGISDRGF
ncbi:hypothetical protein V1477_020831 [Vespula maculifrons]|uniref:Uncharacterized protein n=1 Tax=Vespula maculifrons TaxID=7453 RepID=A0ABD2AN18_VESMC